MKPIYLFILLCVFSLTSYSQYSKHIIQLTDKQGTPHTIANPATYLSAKSIQRRTAHNIAIDSTDLPLNPAYLDSIAAVPNVVIYNKSKWLNQVLIRTNDPLAITKINTFKFVKTVKTVGNNAISNLLPPKLHEPITRIDKPALLGTKSAQQSQGVLQLLDYGNTYGQIHIHEGEFLHNKGYSGQGIEMAMMDAGFYLYKTNPVFDSLRLQNRIRGTWDYVANEESVNEDNEHGAYCFSILASNRPGSLVGSAPHANYWLFRTEDAFSEMPVEEQNWIAAAEFADSAGVQLFSTSLGYYLFDDPSLNYNHAQRDGNTSMITRAADLAAKKGIIVMNSAGNSGDQPNEDKYVIVPADGDSVVAVGAVNVNGVIGSFSSYGPNGAGKIKPNIVSVGVGTLFADVAGNPAAGNGTSFSNPNIAGLVACLWQAFPEKSNMEIIDAVQRSAHKFNNPDERYGFGIPNFRKAYEDLMSRSFKSSFNYTKSIAGLTWTMKADSSVSFIIERRAPGSDQFVFVDSIHHQQPELTFNDYSRSDSIRSAGSGQYVYRIRVLIGKDTGFVSPEYNFNNAWPAMIADSLKLSTKFINCVTEVSWNMTDDSTVVYKLERQLPGTSSYTSLVTFKGTGSYNNTEPKSYNYSDPVSTPLTGTFNYRLQVMLGTDTSFYSKISSFTNLMPCYNRAGYFFTPSPFRNDVLAIMNTTTAATKLNITIHDISGRVVYRYHGSKPAGYYHVWIPTYNLASGVYVATIMVDNKAVYRQKIVK